MVRRVVFLLGAALVAAVTVVALATASRTTGATRAVSPSAETAWPWEPKGSIPAGTADNNWEHGKGDLADSQFSYWKQINTSNVANLKVAWTQHLATPDYAGGIQGSPIVVSGKNKNLPMESGTMYLVGERGRRGARPVEREDPVEVRGSAAEAEHAGRCAGGAAAVRQHDASTSPTATGRSRPGSRTARSRRSTRRRARRCGRTRSRRWRSSPATPARRARRPTASPTPARAARAWCSAARTGARRRFAVTWTRST